MRYAISISCERAMNLMLFMAAPDCGTTRRFSTGPIVVRHQQAALYGHIHQQCVKNQIYVCGRRPSDRRRLRAG
jgi:hypothetical protein